MWWVSLWAFGTYNNYFETWSQHNYCQNGQMHWIWLVHRTTTIITTGLATENAKYGQLSVLRLPVLWILPYYASFLRLAHFALRHVVHVLVMKHYCLCFLCIFHHSRKSAADTITAIKEQLAVAKRLNAVLICSKPTIAITFVLTFHFAFNCVVLSCSVHIDDFNIPLTNFILVMLDKLAEVICCWRFTFAI